VPAHVLSLIRSAAFIAFGALLTCFVCRWLQLRSEDSQNNDLFLFDFTSLSAFWSLALHGETHCFDPSTPLSCYGTSGSLVDFHSRSLHTRFQSLLGLEFVSGWSWQVRWPVMYEKVRTHSLHSDSKARSEVDRPENNSDNIDGIREILMRLAMDNSERLKVSEK
jgi:hypothetical protein